MDVEPVKFVDGLVKGIILLVYDFFRLAVAGFITPFIKHSRRFWPAALATEKRLSSLAYLVMCVLLAVTAATRSGPATSRLLIFDEKANATTFSVISTTLLISLALDVITRIGFLFVGNPSRRHIYEPLTRISIANMFLAAFVIMTIAPSRPFTEFDWVLKLATPNFAYPNPLLFLFVMSFGILIPKALAIKNGRLKLLFGFCACLIIPLVVVNISWWSFLLIDWSPNLQTWLFPVETEQPRFGQQNTECRLSSDAIYVSTFMFLAGTSSIVLDPKSLGVYGQRGKWRDEVSCQSLGRADRDCFGEICRSAGKIRYEIRRKGQRVGIVAWRLYLRAEIFVESNTIPVAYTLPWLGKGN